ncbi:hypothetical protein M2302_004459 [Micromonospora sp. A200]|uniref:hypothetical protein n=1 Tax=Micromonospora sp. A200 TaxID=2940568 RepID=UPI0024772167|nr:hypothetical protein [Micromonospora sp. A200]MDH6464262.1 hypothetical protein [Micromonospora sp. A200]
MQAGNQRRSVRVLVRDNRSEPRLAAQQATDLIRKDRVHALLGTTLRELVFRYIHAYGGFSGFAPYASDDLQLVANAARLASSVDRGRRRAYLQTQVTEGMAGWYAVAPIRHGGMERDSLGVYQLTRGSWARVS